jgi:signal peptidase I
MWQDQRHFIFLPAQPQSFMRTPEFIFSKEHALQCELAGEILRTSGTLRLRVTGWSMLPTLWPGDTLTVEQTSSEAVAPGDIVLFARDRRFFVHRVIEKKSGDQGIQTRGDAMPQMDPPVSNRELLGRVVSIVRNGKCIEPIRKCNMAGRSVAALVRHSPVAAQLAVAMHGALQNL